MKKIPLLVGFVTLAIIVGGVFFLSKEKQSPASDYQPSDFYLYFWGNGCSHCANVEEFLNSWDKKDSTKIDKKEIWYNKANASLMADATNKTCDIPQNQLAVPLLITPEGKCFMGDTPIIDFLKSL